MADNVARLSVDGTIIDLEMQSPSEGNEVIDVASLTTRGYFTYDPGFVSTASCDSAITYINGNEGRLLHRGYTIEELAANASYLELCYLLLFGELPNQKELHSFIDRVKEHTIIDPRFIAIAKQFPKTAHPMGVLCSLVGAMAGIYHREGSWDSFEERIEIAIRLIAQLPICAAIAFRTIRNQPIIPVNLDLDYGEHFLHLMFGESSDSLPNKVLGKAMDRIFLLHADHEQNASTSTVRLAGSTDANPYGCIAAGVAALWGPAHGGANEAVLKMMADIGSTDHIEEYVNRAKDRDDPFRIMGFGHRVYKNYDPRATCLQETCHEVLRELGIEKDPILDLAKALEKVALEDEFFIERKLYPNVDFYSGIILKAMGFPPDMFTVLFAVGRTSGWIAQWHEMVSNGYKIGRPRQLYTGPNERKYLAITER